MESMRPNIYLPIFQLTRGPIVESIHYGAITVVDARGNLVASYGDPHACTYLRSSSKPFQALPFYESGGQETFQLTSKEIALTCASHSGTDEHLAVVRSIQAKTGVQEADLMCGVHPPYHKYTAELLRARGEAPTPNRHNCSGKHTAMLAYARLLGFPPDPDGLPYIDPHHPVQDMILQSFAEMCDLQPDEVAVGIDGCSAPNFAVPLHNAALAFARLCQPDGLAEKRTSACRMITAAMLAYPDMVGGPDNFDTLLMQALPGRVICKGGAEGYQAMGVLPGALRAESPGLGITFKISDGDLKGHNRPVEDPRGRVRPAVALEILFQLGVISETELKSLSDFGPGFPVDNWRKVVVGWAAPCFKLNKTG
jgi:L-asparaginase II